MSSFSNGGIRDPVESETVDVIQKRDYSLDTVNNNNLLDTSEADGYCYTVINEILKKHDSRGLNLQNHCGWTPLMEAIRDGNVENVKLLLANGCSPEQSTFQGISAIALSVAISREMFETVNEACPSALEKSKNNSISPLCVAAMKNDKESFFRLLELGLKVSEAGDYTLLMMAQSTVPEIAKLSEIHRDESESYELEDSSIDKHEKSFSSEEFEVPQMSSTLQGTDNSLECKNDSRHDNSEIPSICVSPPDETRSIAEINNSEPRKINFDNNSASPQMEKKGERLLATSPNMCLARRENTNNSEFGKEVEINRDKMDKDRDNGTADSSKNSVISNDGNKMYKFQMKRPPNLQISRDDDYEKSKDKSGKTPLSPNKTPIEPGYQTPLRRLTLDIHQQKMALLLKRFGLTHFIPIFLEQEVDLDLFLSLNDQDLQEIGIEKKSDRIILQSVIVESNRNKLFI